jgi:hypothetical protein
MSKDEETDKSSARKRKTKPSRLPPKVDPTLIGNEARREPQKPRGPKGSEKDKRGK